MDLEPILQAVRRAARLCHEVQQTEIVHSSKTGKEPVTIADYGSQAMICEAISRTFPNDEVMAEESGEQFTTLVDDAERSRVIELISTGLGHPVDEQQVVAWLDFNKNIHAERTWVIDPIDGTKGFLALRHFAIAVGVLENGVPVAGVMGCPGYPGYDGGALFYAQEGRTYVQPLNDPSIPLRQVFTTRSTEPSKIRVLESVEKTHASHDRMERVRIAAGLEDSQLERVDSQEKYARIAAGDGELYLRLPRLNSENRHFTWDHAAGAALVYAAGGQATDIDGAPLDFSQGRMLSRNQGMIVSNGAIHARVLEAVAQVLTQEAHEAQE
jgi:HAL2 family 3'(2'),5'-bisphosphate nucleotidase